jgi:tetratricopeptide (TPR) repeat protein
MREVEMQLLASLEESDAAIEELIHLWSTERDETAANDLIQMQSQCSEGLVEEEAKLRSMCHNFVGWAEPYARLTTLLYYLGRTEEAVTMAEQAIALKPWHFEVLQMSILLARHEQSDPDTVARSQHLARNAMPVLAEDPEGRRAWVSRALVWAKQQLAEAEEMTFRAQRYSNSLTEDDIWQ